MKTKEYYEQFVATVPHFPIEGIMFKDITPTLEDAEAFQNVINDLAEVASNYEFDKVILSTGSKAGLIKGEKENGSKLLNPFGLSFKPFVPGLCKLKLDGYDFETVKGVRNEAKVCLLINENRSPAGTSVFLISEKNGAY